MRSIIYDRNGNILGIDFSCIYGLPTQYVSCSGDMVRYVRNLNSVGSSRDYRQGYIRDMNRIKLECKNNSIKRQYRDYIIRPSISLYERKVEIRESKTLSKGMYYLLAFENGNCCTEVQYELLQGRRIFSEHSIVQVPLNEYNNVEFYAANWGINSDKLILLIKDIPENIRVYNLIKESLDNCGLALMSGAFGRVGLQVIFLDMLGR